ncbi:MAG TPA: VOC family protein [Hydrogenophaga sp.]|uniref:VOC family protein n=1 Tax=Hydrogenophaga sp. TaxID=1904254 RepID=UPI002B8C3279|nr:VOC family protein [Hydrogenophaga sp.]HSX93119.1 VOC family protein [Hydrogenophaga sp.]
MSDKPRYQDHYPIVVTPDIRACQAFWEQHLGWSCGFASSWFVWLCSEDGSASLAFMSPDHPSAPPGPETFSGLGLCFELQVADAKAAHADFLARGGPVGLPLTDEPFGQRRFGFRDPSGLWVDVVEQMEPQAGFWDRYMV